LNPAGGAYIALPDSLAGFKVVMERGREGKRWEKVGRGREERGSEGGESKGKECRTGPLIS